MDTRRQILDAALACIAEVGVEQTTIAAVRGRSGVSNGALFHHFPTKRAIAEALYVEATEAAQEGFWRLLDAPPAKLADAVAGIVTHQLTWVEEHPEQARLIYALDRLAPRTPSGRELGALNRDLAGALRRWLDPLVRRGEVRDAPIDVMVAVVTGPAHAICRRWLAGDLQRSPVAFAPELAAAATAALTGTPTVSPPPTRLPEDLRVQLVDADGGVVAVGTLAVEGTDR